jgi:hypothetical protein
MKFFLVTVFLASVGYVVKSQDTGDFMIAAHMDIIKNDYDAYFQKAQVGLEGNYFLSRKFTATAGLEVWTRTGASAVMGIRWYPGNDGFVRMRGLLGSNDDLSIGAGWAKPMSEVLKFEAMADFYLQGTFAIRAGFTLVIRNQ